MGNFITRIKSYFHKKKPVEEAKIWLYSNGYTEFTEEEYELWLARQASISPPETFREEDLHFQRTEEYMSLVESYLQASQARTRELQKVMNDFE